VVIKNFGSGGGKIRAANYLTLQAPVDGTFALQGDNSPVQPETVRRKVARYDPRDWKLVGSINRGGRLVFVRKEAQKRLMDPKAKPVIVGATTGSRAWQIILTTAKEHLGWNLRWIPGYEDSATMRRALRQGEIDMFATGTASVVNELVKDGVIVLVAQEGQFVDGKYVPRDSYPKVPVYPDMLAAAKPPKVAIEAYNTVQLPGVVDKWFALPPKAPNDVVKAYRTAYGKLFKNAEFMEAVKKQVSDEIYYIKGEDAEKLFRDMLDVSKDAVDYAAKLRKKFNIGVR
jgi:tripartite-type tricarboxylate transporter receptor subunit TctC